MLPTHKSKSTAVLIQQQKFKQVCVRCYFLFEMFNGRSALKPLLNKNQNDRELYYKYEWEL